MAGHDIGELFVFGGMLAFTWLVSFGCRRWPWRLFDSAVVAGRHSLQSLFIIIRLGLYTASFRQHDYSCKIQTV